MRLRDWLVRFQESERRALRPSTLARDQVYVRTQILPTFGDIALARIEHQAIQEWVNQLSERFAPTTVHKCHQILRNSTLRPSGCAPWGWTPVTTPSADRSE
jgi:hypothetical protein